MHAWILLLNAKQAQNGNGSEGTASSPSTPTIVPENFTIGNAGHALADEDVQRGDDDLSLMLQGNDGPEGPRSPIAQSDYTGGIDERRSQSDDDDDDMPFYGSDKVPWPCAQVFGGDGNCLVDPTLPVLCYEGPWVKYTSPSPDECCACGADIGRWQSYVEGAAIYPPLQVCLTCERVLGLQAGNSERECFVVGDDGMGRGWLRVSQPGQDDGAKRPRVVLMGTNTPPESVQQVPSTSQSSTRAYG